MISTLTGFFGRLLNKLLLILLNILPIKNTFSLKWATQGLLPVPETRAAPRRYFQEKHVNKEYAVKYVATIMPHGFF